MTASKKQREEAQQKKEKAWELYCLGIPNYKIGAQLGVTPARITQYIAQMAKEHPVNKLSMEQQMAVQAERWQAAEDAIRSQVLQQMVEGVVTTELITAPDGSVTKRVITKEGADPALLRAWSTHADRRARQLQGQISPDAGVNQVNVQVMKDFIGQGETKGQLSAGSWNEQQGSIDV